MRGRVMILAAASLVLGACASDPVPFVPAAGSADAGAVATGTTLTVNVKDRAVTLRWEEDEWQHHCLVLTQKLATQSKPVEGMYCTGKSAQTTVTFGDNLVAGGADYGWATVKGFAVGPATWKLLGGPPGAQPATEVGSGKLQIGTHFGGPCVSKGAVATGLSEWHAKAPVTLDISVGLTVAARQNIEIVTPEIWVDSVPAKGVAAPGGTLQFKYTFDTAGMYVVEVNNTGGGAILNCAVYVGAGVPLVPVEVTGGAGLSAPPTADQLKSMRQKLLGLVNNERASIGLAALTSDDKLHEIAQYHSDNMATQGFFAHTDKLGMGPGERAKKFGFVGGVGENIASNSSIEGAHSGLFWSAGHRANMLGKDWTRVGFGIAKAADSKNLLVTENFAGK